MASTLHHQQNVPQASMSFHRPASDVSSFSSRQPSFSSSMPPHPHPNPYSHSSPTHDGMNHNAGSFRSFDAADLRPPGSSHGAQIYTAVYSGVPVYEMEVHDVAVMRRRSDSWFNATQILKVAGVEKGKRTKILEKEILTGEHEKVQGGYGKYQGTWINYHRAYEFCRQYGVEDLLRSILEYDPGAGGPGRTDTPTKEQAMAANRKRFYSTGIDQRSGGAGASNTFFQNISPTASNALAAMNRAARFESPMPRSGSVSKKPLGRQHPSQQQNSQDSAQFGSQQSFRADHGELRESMSGSFQADSSFLDGTSDNKESSRKRKRQHVPQQDPYLDPLLQDDAPTEPNESFSQQHYARETDQGPQSLQPLSAADDKVNEEKKLALLDLFADPIRTDFTSHTAILHLSGQDLDISLDSSANTALHWAATLGRVSLMRLLISKGANIFRGNVAGQTPLMAAVQVNNCLDHGCFNEVLDTLGPLIEIRDSQGRTVLHHIAVSSGIKGRGQSSRYYLESLLEFTVRQGSITQANSTSVSASNSQQQGIDPSNETLSGNNSQQNSTAAIHSNMRPITLSRFMSDVVNVQDKSGNTALNLVARIGNHVIINQLDEVGADYNIANHAGFRPTDFGVYPRSHNNAQNGALSSQGSNGNESNGEKKTPSQIDQIREEIFATTSSILTQTQSHYTSELSKTQSRLDTQTNELRQISTSYKSLSKELHHLRSKAKDRENIRSKISKLKRGCEELTGKLGAADGHSANREGKDIDESLIDPALLKDLPTPPASPETDNDSEAENLPPHVVERLNKLPAMANLSAITNAYSANAKNLQDKITTLKSRSSELDGQYKRVIALCTSVDEDKIEELAEGLCRAVESDVLGDSAGGDGAKMAMGGAKGTGLNGEEGKGSAGRVREFLRLVEGA